MDEPISFERASRLVRRHVRALPSEETRLAEACGRVLAERVSTTHSLPPFPSSVVDGYAVRSRDVRSAGADRPVELEVVGEITAGSAQRIELGPRQAVRIMTGAPVPSGADAVVMLEWTRWGSRRVQVERPVRWGQFIRREGEEARAGEVVLEPGRTLGAAAVGLLASVGRTHVRVHRCPRVGVLVTGDELVAPGEPLGPGQVRSSNDATLSAQILEAGGEVLELGMAPDDPGELALHLARGRECDVLVTSGGVSVGDRDQIRSALESLGFSEIFWRVASSPGKPLLFGRLGDQLVFGLPGNPVSSMVAFENFVRPVLRLLQGDRRPERPRVLARAREPIAGARGRRHFARVRLLYDSEGYHVLPVGPRGSANLRSMVSANALAVVPEDRPGIAEGERVEVMVLADPEPAS